MSYKVILSVIAIIITFYAFLPYINSILKGKIRPHIFSWLIWGTTTFIVFLAQLKSNGGVGAWPIGVSAVITIFIAVLAFVKRADITITKTDWVFFISAISSLPFWFLTSNPLLAVVILTIVDVSGFAPTIRKSWNNPYSESLIFFLLFAVRNLIVIVALESRSLTTVLFPAVISFACIVLITLIIYRRHANNHQKYQANK